MTMSANFDQKGKKSKLTGNSATAQVIFVKLLVPDERCQQGRVDEPELLRLLAPVTHNPVVLLVSAKAQCLATISPLTLCPTGLHHPRSVWRAAQDS